MTTPIQRYNIGGYTITVGDQAHIQQTGQNFQASVNSAQPTSAAMPAPSGARMGMPHPGHHPYGGQQGYVFMDPATYSLPRLLNRYRQLQETGQKLSEDRLGARSMVPGAPKNLQATQDSRMQSLDNDMRQIEGLIRELYGPGVLSFAMSQNWNPADWDPNGIPEADGAPEEFQNFDADTQNLIS